LTSSLFLTLPEIFNNLFAGDIWRKSSSSQHFLEHQEIANASPNQEDPYLLPHKNVKLFACSVHELWTSKVVVANPDMAAAAVVAMTVTRVVTQVNAFSATKIGL
jgi:hypothetical protein